MSRRARLLVAAGVLALAAGGCGEARPAPPRDAANGCRAAIEASGDGRVRSTALREALACERLYRGDACGTAWVAATRADEDELAGALAALEVTCRRDCLRRSAGSPPRGCVDPVDRFGLGDGDQQVLWHVMEVDAALHQLAGLGRDEAELLARRVTLLAMGGGDHGPPRLLPDGGVEIELTVDELRVGGRLVDAADLRSRLEELRQRHGVQRVVVKTDPALPYQRIIEVLDAIHAAGIDEVGMAVR